MTRALWLKLVTATITLIFPALIRCQDLAFASCDPSSKQVVIWAEPEFLHVTAKAKCNEQLSIVGSQGAATRVRTKKGKEGWVLTNHLSEEKAKKASSGAWRNMLAGMAVGAAAGASGMNTAAEPKLMIFGGTDHKNYLGCLNCSEHSADSVLNEYGTHGNAYGADSIWNHYSTYGSAYSSQGACNAYATDPPVIVDQDGNFYGRLTLNEYHSQIGIGRRYIEWLRTRVCES